MQRLTVSEYARRRGCDEKAVRKAIDEGRIIAFEADGRRWIDPDVADIQWAKNTRARVNSRAAAEQPAAGGSGTAAAAPAQPSPTAGDDSYQMVRIRRERAEAERAELDLAERRGELRRVGEIRGPIASALSSLREGLLQLPKRLAPQLVAEQDQALIERTLDAAIREQLAKAASLEEGGLDGRS